MAKDPIVLSFSLTAEVKFYSSLLMKKMKYDQTIWMPVFHNLLKLFTGSSKLAEGLKGGLSLQDFQKQAIKKKRKAFNVSTSYKHQKIPPAIPIKLQETNFWICCQNLLVLSSERLWSLSSSPIPGAAKPKGSPSLPPQRPPCSPTAGSWARAPRTVSNVEVLMCNPENDPYSSLWT